MAGDSQPGRAGSWRGTAVSVTEIERRLAELRQTCGDGAGPELRTSVMTHIGWVPAEWEEAATQVRTGLGARHPSLAIVLYPRPDEGDSERFGAFRAGRHLDGEQELVGGLDAGAGLRGVLGRPGRQVGADDEGEPGEGCHTERQRGRRGIPSAEMRKGHEPPP